MIVKTVQDDCMEDPSIFPADEMNRIWSDRVSPGVTGGLIP